MEIRQLLDAPLGVEVIGLDLQAAGAEEIAAAVHAMHRAGKGLLIFRAQHLTPRDVEAASAKLAPHFVGQLPYQRWAGQSKPIPGCPHLALLGNYRARVDGEFGMDVRAGEVIGEFKPARNTIEEWHTDGSFLPDPKVAIGLYAPQVDDALPLEGGETRFASATAAFESLPETEQARLQGLASVHSWAGMVHTLQTLSQKPKTLNSKPETLNP